MAKAISIDPSGNWDGVGKQWSSFVFSVGSSKVRLLPSTSSTFVWAIEAEACNPTDSHTLVPEDCDELHGWTVNRKAADVGFSEAASIGSPFVLEARDLKGPYAGLTAYFGYANVSLGDNSDGEKVEDTAVVLSASNFPVLGFFGLNGDSTHLNADREDVSPLKALNFSDQIPSAYWAYQAGPRYRATFGSLTLGGYDSSQGDVNALKVGMQYPDTSKALTLWVDTVHIEGGRSSQKSAPAAMSAFIDSAIDGIWLPKPICQVFESELGIHWNESVNMYLLDEEDRQRLRQSNVNVTFSLGAKQETALRLNITLPYDAFDQNISLKMLGYDVPDFASQYYFPLKQAANESQYYLGRTFLQEAYLTADYDRNEFSISQALFPESSREVTLTTVYAPGKSPASPQPDPVRFDSKASLSHGTIAGIVVGALAGIAVLAAALFWFWWRPRKLKKTDEGVARRTTPFAINPLDAPEQEKRNTEYYAPDEAESEIKGPHQLDAIHTARPGLTGRHLSHELDAGSVHRLSTSQLSGRTEVSSLPERRPTHVRIPSDPSSIGAPSPQSLESDGESPIPGCMSPQLGQDTGPVSNFFGPLVELPSRSRSRTSTRMFKTAIGSRSQPATSDQAIDREAEDAGPATLPPEHEAQPVDRGFMTPVDYEGHGYGSHT